MLGRIHIVDLTRDELFNCYEAAWNIMEQWTVESKAEGYNVSRQEIQNAIETQFGKLDAVMSGDLLPTEFASAIIRLAAQE